MIYREEHQEKFLKTYNISQGDYEKTGLKFEDLLAIKADFEEKFQMYDDAGANLVRVLLRFKKVHSVKYRVKDSEHLIEKIIRKKVEHPDLEISLENYEEKIQDLIGIRILHLFKSDWLAIHDKLKENFKIIQSPEANIRKGDPDGIYKANYCEVKIHKAGYRSVHYIIISEPTIKKITAEVQVRTILEEAWSEIDHKIRYPYNQNNKLLNEYLQIFNRLAGGADEMGDYVLMLSAEMEAKEQIIEEQREQIQKLSDRLEKSSLNKKEKKEIIEKVDALSTLNKLRAQDYIYTNLIRHSDINYTDALKSIADQVRDKSDYIDILKKYNLWQDSSNQSSKSDK